MQEVAREIGRTVRVALHSWPETIRLCLLVAVGITATWTCYQLWGR
jgi:hypothetical protein